MFAYLSKIINRVELSVLTVSILSSSAQRYNDARSTTVERADELALAELAHGRHKPARAERREQSRLERRKSGLDDTHGGQASRQAGERANRVI
jgi:hypothetical protein